MPLPTREEFIVYGDLDEIAAYDRFGGKTLEQMRECFHEDPFDACSALMWIGPRAFEYYLPAALDYVTSHECTENDTMIDCLYGALAFRVDTDRAILCTSRVRDTLDYIVDHFETFGAADDDLRSKYVELKRLLFEAPSASGTDE